MSKNKFFIILQGKGIQEEPNNISFVIQINNRQKCN